MFVVSSVSVEIVTESGLFRFVNSATEDGDDSTYLSSVTYSIRVASISTVNPVSSQQLSTDVAFELVILASLNDFTRLYKLYGTFGYYCLCPP
jgi:hypothetical protein